MSPSRRRWASSYPAPERHRVGPSFALKPPFRALWTFHGRALLEFPPAVAYGRLYLTTFDGRFYALDSKLAGTIPDQAYLIALYSVGILHFWYDSFIWKLRKPAVAANFGIKAPAPA